MTSGRSAARPAAACAAPSPRHLHKERDVRRPTCAPEGELHAVQPGTSSRTCLLCHAVPHRAIRTPANNAHRLRHTLTSPYYTSFSWTRRETSRRPPRSRRSMSSRMPFSITSTATSSPSGSPLFQINAIKIQFSRDHDFAVKIYSFLRLLSFLSFTPRDLSSSVFQQKNFFFLRINDPVLFLNSFTTLIDDNVCACCLRFPPLHSTSQPTNSFSSQSYRPLLQSRHICHPERTAGSQPRCKWSKS